MQRSLWMLEAEWAKPLSESKDAGGHGSEKHGGGTATAATSTAKPHTPESVQSFADAAIASMRGLHQEHEKKYGFNKGPHNKKLADEVHARLAELDSMAAATKHKPTLKAIADAKQRLGAFVRAMV